MKIPCLCALLVAGCATQLRAQDFLERLDERLTITAFDDNVRARLSGTIDLEYYHFQQPAPGLLDASGNDLFSPRLTAFFDAQIGPTIYSSHRRGSTGISTQRTKAHSYGSMNMRRASRHGKMVA